MSSRLAAAAAAAAAAARGGGGRRQPSCNVGRKRSERRRRGRPIVLCRVGGEKFEVGPSVSVCCVVGGCCGELLCGAALCCAVRLPTAVCQQPHTHSLTHSLIHSFIHSTANRRQTDRHAANHALLPPLPSSCVTPQPLHTFSALLFPLLSRCLTGAMHCCLLAC